VCSLDIPFPNFASAVLVLCGRHITSVLYKNKVFNFSAKKYALIFVHHPKYNFQQSCLLQVAITTRDNAEHNAEQESSFAELSDFLQLRAK